MVKKKVDPRVKGLIEHGVRTNHRSLFILVGDHGKDQVENIHRILSKTQVKSRPSVLWCYKKELGFSTHRQKRMKEIKKMQARGLYDADRDDPFELFISSTNIRWTYYKETDKILGQTFGMCVLQDFEALTPNLLARTVETVEGGGLVIILLKTVKSLRQLYSLTMDVHTRFRTEAHHEIVPRFNERFILSLSDCAGCLVLDDELNILPLSSNVNFLPSEDSHPEEGLANALEDPELTALKASVSSTPHVGNLVGQTRSVDQAKAVTSFLEAIADKSLRSTVSLTAGRGRGKSAAIGLCLAGSVAYGYSNIFVTAPSPENLKTCFEFVIAGLKCLKYVEHMDFEVLQEHSESGKVVTRINIFRNHRQTIQYILPTDHVKLSQAELVAIDEAAAIPLPTVKKLLGPYLVFMSSTINGYEGTGRSLSLKLIQQLRQRQGASVASQALQAGSEVGGGKHKKGERRLHEDRWNAAAQVAAGGAGAGGRKLIEIELKVPIRYAAQDPVESWLHRLLCLDVQAQSTRIVRAMPAPKDCDLYIVDRDALFSYHQLAEALLQRIWALYTAAHYKNAPNDLQILSDAPAHRLFVLLGPQTNAAAAGKSKDPAASLPDILCVVQVAFEGKISQKTVQSELGKGNKASGDLVPWTIAQQFNDSEFASLSGARIVRIATHPDVQSMGYGSRAVDLLLAYFQGELTAETLSPAEGIFGAESSGTTKDRKRAAHGDAHLLTEDIRPSDKLPPLLSPISSRPAERLHYVGVSFGLTAPLLGFWARKGFQVCYVRQTPNELTGEHSTIVLRELDCSDLHEEGTPAAGWLAALASDYRSRLVHLLGYSLRQLPTALALTLVDPEKNLTAAVHDVLAAASGGGDGGDDGDDSAPLGETGAASSSSSVRPLTAQELTEAHLSYHDLKRLELYARNMVDHHMVLDLVPRLAAFLFLQRLRMRVSTLQAAVLLGVGLQHRDVDSLCAELDLPANQVLAFFNKTVRKLCTHLREMVEREAAKSLTSEASLVRIARRSAAMHSLPTSLGADQDADASDFAHRRQELLMGHKDLARHAVGAGAETLQQAAQAALQRQAHVPHLVSVPKQAAPRDDEDEQQQQEQRHGKRKEGSGREEKSRKKGKRDH